MITIRQRLHKVAIRRCGIQNQAFADSLRRELADTSIAVHYVAPRATQTGLTTDLIRRMNDELKVGMYIDLNCSWFKHPFPRKTFRIASLSQLTTIQGLGLLEGV